MTEKLPEPLVAAEIDLRGYEFMPLYGDRLKKSETWVMANPEGKVAALALWWHSYGHEVPAGTLPDNDTLLADYAGYGVALKSWMKIKPQAMRGWIKCADGRLYHRFVAELVTEAWKFKTAQRNRTEKARLTRLSQNQSQTGNRPVTSSVTASTVQDSTGQDSTSKNSSASTQHRTAARPAEPKPPPASEKVEVKTGPEADLAEMLAAEGVTIAASDALLTEWINRGITIEIATVAVELARSPNRKPAGPIPAAYLGTIVNDLLTGKTGTEPDDTRPDPQCTEIVDGTRCGNAAVRYPGRSRKGQCQEHAE